MQLRNVKVRVTPDNYREVIRLLQGAGYTSRVCVNYEQADRSATAMFGNHDGTISWCGYDNSGDYFRKHHGLELVVKSVLQLEEPKPTVQIGDKTYELDAVIARLADLPSVQP